MSACVWAMGWHNKQIIAYTNIWQSSTLSLLYSYQILCLIDQSTMIAWNVEDNTQQVAYSNREQLA